MLIKVYGEFWRLDYVYWGKKGPGGGGKLEGTTRIGKRELTVDNWNQSGIYILYQDRDLLYVGQAARNDLGARLRHHLSDRLAGRWNRFSWYGVRPVDKNTGEQLAPPKEQGVDPHYVLMKSKQSLLVLRSPG